jgi:hypothetical protein
MEAKSRVKNEWEENSVLRTSGQGDFISAGTRLVQHGCVDNTRASLFLQCPMEYFSGHVHDLALVGGTLAVGDN